MRFRRNYCANSARVQHLNSVHGLYLRTGLKRLGRSLLPLASLNSMTLLGAETVGRAYGGGLLKLEPKEADLLPVPSPALAVEIETALSALRPVVVDALHRNKLLDAVDLVDQVVLVDGLGLGRAEVKVLRDARDSLAGRRAARGRSTNGSSRR